jgi:hypothetical protein
MNESNLRAADLTARFVSTYFVETSCVWLFKLGQSGVNERPISVVLLECLKVKHGHQNISSFSSAEIGDHLALGALRTTHDHKVMYSAPI